jgi:hypothetical protein
MKHHGTTQHHGTTAAATLAWVLAAHLAQAQVPVPVPVPDHAPAVARTGAPAAPAGAEEIRDIRGPKPVAGDWTLPIMLLAGLLIGASAYGAWAWSRRGRAERSALAVALERLAAARALIGTPHGREFSIEISDAVRAYIESQFRVRAAHRTTDEFLHDLMHSSQRALAAHRGTLAVFLETCDLAKFGGWNLSAAEMEDLCAAAVRFVTESGATADSPDSPASPVSSTLEVSHVPFPST